MDRAVRNDVKNLHEHDLEGLAKLCGKVAYRSADYKQGDAAHALRMEWIRLILDSAPSDDDKKEASKVSLKKRMAEFLATVPDWMSGLGPNCRENVTYARWIFQQLTREHAIRDLDEINGQALEPSAACGC